MLIFVNDCSHSYRKYNNFLSQKSEKSERNFVKNHEISIKKARPGVRTRKKAQFWNLYPSPLTVEM